MSRTNCPEEASVLRAARVGGLPEALASHVAGCAGCREAVETLRWMQSLARGDTEQSALPDAKVIWWRAQLSDQRAKAGRTPRLLEWLELATGLVVPLCIAGWIAWHWFSIQGEAMKLLLGVAPGFALAASVCATLAPALLLLAATFLAYPLLLRD